MASQSFTLRTTVMSALIGVERELAQLDELHSMGFIQSEEYEQRRAALLGGDSGLDGMLRSSGGAERFAWAGSADASGCEEWPACTLSCGVASEMTRGQALECPSAVVSPSGECSQCGQVVARQAPGDNSGAGDRSASLTSASESEDNFGLRMQQHMEVCPRSRRPCPNAASGCAAKLIPGEVAEHLAKRCAHFLTVCHSCTTDRLLFPPERCAGVDMHGAVTEHGTTFVPRRLRDLHLESHRRVRIQGCELTCPVPGCERTFEADEELRRHVPECPRFVVRCPDFGLCAAEMPRSELAAHFRSHHERTNGGVLPARMACPNAQLYGCEAVLESTEMAVHLARCSQRCPVAECGGACPLSRAIDMTREQLQTHLLEHHAEQMCVSPRTMQLYKVIVQDLQRVQAIVPTYCYGRPPAFQRRRRR